MSDEVLMKMQRIIASDHCTADQMCGDCPCKESANRIFSEIMSPAIEALRAENARLRKALRPFATAKVNRMFPQSPMYYLNYLEQDGDPFQNAIVALGETDG